ncbi:nuclear transport factor 2 family protein [Streptomyces sp. NPDC096132]|uniref:nuclear transport factor 2 family protein n=1 Tax=Streptomyces sp. NPDC096132 TaxID=3366075 RepID=UPI00381F08C9
MSGASVDRRAEVDAIFAVIDAVDIDALVAHFAPDGTQRFGNQEPARGRAAIAEANRSFLGSLDGISHRVMSVIGHDRTTAIELEVTYRVGGRTVTIPVATAYDTNADGLISDYRVYFDPAPVFGTTMENDRP